MNTLLQKTITGLGLALSLGLTSCEKDNSLNPNPVGSARSGAGDEVISPNFPQVHKLTKHGNATLSYNDNGQLLNVMTPVRGSLAIQTDYTYGPGTIRAFTHQGKTILRDETFTLDASGRCTESAEAITVVNNNVPLHYLRQWVFAYNEKGQLWHYQNKNSCVGGFGYSYNADGDMISATETTGISSSFETTFNYSPASGDPIMSDKYPLNVIGVNEHDAYLRIFGKPGKHLVTLVTRQASLDGDYYAYQLDADGYVTQRKQYKLIGAALVDTKSYEYVTANMGLPF
ncbi:DUF4595 domain-containing protein [Spirosoma spitsbergense]|uniref:DUF4595 domain-containing protein n=1 Tax=Spirosoma spitsbergense TaxID=431554 RepID=UPI00036E7606|nr:DUF4595 domain-containing protein [Spirosoma spitsbergense]